MIDFTKNMTRKNLAYFAAYLNDIQRKIGFKVSARGWCYLLEGERVINKDQFDKVERWVNRCRRDGILPIDFTADEEGRTFSGVEKPDSDTPVEYSRRYLDAVLTCGEWYTPDWWTGEKYYIQLIVEKIDLKTLFSPVCEKYHIPIANSKGWASMRLRGEYARRFKHAEERGLTPLLLYCGDHDPDGLRISDTIRKNLVDVKDIVWENGATGYDPATLKIERFGLNADFIERHGLTWIDNLITGSGKNLASPKHKNYKFDYVQDYLGEIGARKCEANAIVTMPDVARQLVEDIILNYLGDDVLRRFEAKQQKAIDEIMTFQKKHGIDTAIKAALKHIE